MLAISVRRLLLSAACLVAVSSAPSGAQVTAHPSSPVPSPVAPSTDLARARVDSMLRNGHADSQWFAASFLAQVSAAQVDAIVAQYKTTLGEYRGIEGANGDYTARFAKGTDEVFVHLDAENEIDALLFKEPKLQASSLDDALRALRPAAGTLSYVIVENRSELAQLDASSPLAVGSAFKLAVLSALRDEIARGRRRWSDVVPLQSRWKSLPTGVLQTWPDATPITLATYAAEMMSVSDNTAADALIRLTGPAALAPYAMGNVPFLTTREMFQLKSASGATQRAAYLAARTPDQRSAVLRRIDATALPAIGALESKPILAIEWHYSVRQLCELMRRVAGLPVMSINSGVADATSFRRVAFKGGSDAGVLNLTTQVQTKRGTAICFSATLNDSTKAVAATAFELSYAAALSALANR
ncbi:MAG: serine hydrolase [Candidatus Tumulicola sp.]